MMFSVWVTSVYSQYVKEHKNSSENIIFVYISYIEYISRHFHIKINFYLKQGNVVYELYETMGIRIKEEKYTFGYQWCVEILFLNRFSGLLYIFYALDCLGRCSHCELTSSHLVVFFFEEDSCIKLSYN